MLARHWPVAILLVATALLTASRFGNALVWDDVHLLDVAEMLAREGAPLKAFRHSTLGLVRGEPDEDRSGAVDMYRPLALLTFYAGYALAGREPTPQHALNLGLHLACILLVYALARARGGERAGVAAWIAAAWFALSPQLAEAHVWISGRFDVLCAFFTLLAILIWQGPARRGRDVGVALAFLCALLSKEAALMVLVALPIWPSAVPWRERLRRCIPFAVALALYIALRASALGAGASKSLDLFAAAARFGPVVIDAIASLLWPARVYVRMPNEDYDALGLLWIAAAALALLLAYGALRLRARAPFITYGYFWLCALLVPIAWLTLEPRPGFGRYLYLPAALFFIGLADAALLAYEAIAREGLRRALRALLAVQLLAFALALAAFTQDFRDDDTLFSRIIAEAPERSHGYAYLGLTFIERKQFDKAAVLLERAVELAPTHRMYAAKLGQALLFSGQHEAARKLARDTRARLGDDATFHLIEAYALLKSDPAAALREVRECLRLNPEYKACKEAERFLLSPAAR